MGRFQRSIELAKASWATLKADRELLWLPVLSFGAAAIMIVITAGLVFLIDYDSAAGADEFSLGPASYVVLIVAGLALSVSATYFQAAMVGGARQRLTGGDPTVSSALATASGRIAVVAAWGAFSWTVGALLRALEERLGFLGAIVARLAGMAFRVVTFLAVPVLVVEGLGPIDTLKRCGTLFRQTWGENLAGQLGLGLLSFVALIPGLVVGGLLGAAVHPIAGLVVAVPWVALVLVATTSLTAIYQTALYQYVTTGAVPSGFEQADLPNAFRTR
ncbi:MAG: DUF6159 family protein [Acidimicrobiales bacterium]